MLPASFGVRARTASLNSLEQRMKSSPGVSSFSLCEEDIRRLHLISGGIGPGTRLAKEDESFLFSKNREITGRIAQRRSCSSKVCADGSAGQAEQGDIELSMLIEAKKAIREMIAESVLRIVMLKAYDASRGDMVRYKEAVQEGLLEIEKNLIDGFDSKVGCRFSSYVYAFIKHKMERAHIDTGSTVRIPVNTVEKKAKIQAFERRYCTINGLMPDEDEISKGTGIMIETIRRVHSLVREAYGRGSDEEPDLISSLPDTHVPAPDVALELIESGRPMTHLISRLPEREQRVISMRFGFDGQDDLTLQQVGDILGLSRERVRQIETNALTRLRRLIQIEDQRRSRAMAQREEKKGLVPLHPQEKDPAESAETISDSSLKFGHMKTRREKKPRIYERIAESYSAGEPLRDIAQKEGLEYIAVLRLCKEIREENRSMRRAKTRGLVFEAFGEDGADIFDSIEGKVQISDTYLRYVHLGFERVFGILGFMGKNDILVLDGKGWLYFP